MGAKHPEQVLSQLKCNKNEFILAATHLVRTGICKSGPDAIRYMEKNNSDVSRIVEEIVESQRVKPPAVVEEEEQETKDE